MEFNLQNLSIGGKLGDGAQGAVFELLGKFSFSFPVVFKRFKPEVSIRPQLLSKLILFREGLNSKEQVFIDASTTWPLASVSDGKRTVGYLMRRIPSDFFIDLHSPSGKRKTLCEIQLLKKSDKTFRLDHGFLISPEERIRLASELARIYSFLHQNGFVYGDLNWRNALWSVSKGCFITLLDCDGIRKKGSSAASEQMHSPNWTPRGIPSVQSVETDCYKLALAILRILSPGLNSQLQGDRDEHFTFASAIASNQLIEMLKRSLSPSTPKGSLPRAADFHAQLKTESPSSAASRGSGKQRTSSAGGGTKKPSRISPAVKTAPKGPAAAKSSLGRHWQTPPLPPTPPPSVQQTPPLPPTPPPAVQQTPTLPPTPAPAVQQRTPLHRTSAPSAQQTPPLPKTPAPLASPKSAASMSSCSGSFLLAAGVLGLWVFSAIVDSSVERPRSGGSVIPPRVIVTSTSGDSTGSGAATLESRVGSVPYSMSPSKLSHPVTSGDEGSKVAISEATKSSPAPGVGNSKPLDSASVASSTTTEQSVFTTIYKRDGRPMSARFLALGALSIVVADEWGNFFIIPVQSLADSTKAHLKDIKERSGDMSYRLREELRIKEHINPWFLEFSGVILFAGKERIDVRIDEFHLNGDVTAFYNGISADVKRDLFSGETRARLDEYLKFLQGF